VGWSVLPGTTRWEEQYRAGSIPWNIGKPDVNLVEIVTKRPILSCKALDIGCGTGDDAVWLAQQGFEVTGTDVSRTALEMTAEKASQAGVKCTFLVMDFLESKVPGAPFGFVFDRGCFHSFDEHAERKRFAANAAAHLGKNGLWLSLVGNADEERQGPGPPQRTATDIVTAIEPYFEILTLESGHFGSNRPDPPRAWVCLMLKRVRL
jgi:SAM-dependent methyltransferase